MITYKKGNQQDRSSRHTLPVLSQITLILDNYINKTILGFELEFSHMCKCMAGFTHLLCNGPF